MKNQKKFILWKHIKKAFLMLAVVSLLGSCQNNDELIPPTATEGNHTHRKTVQKISFQTAQNDPLFVKAFNDFKLQDIQLKGKGTNSSSLQINLESINKIEKNHATTYTFLVDDRNDDLPPFAFKNLVVEITPTKTQGYFITYYPTQEYIREKALNNTEVDFKAKVAITPLKENINELLQQIRDSKNLRGRDCTKYIIIETKCRSGLHWPGDNSCELNGGDRAQTYSLPVLDAGCDGGGGSDGSGSGSGNLNLGSNQNIGIPGSGSGVGNNNPSPVTSGATFPNIPSGLSNTNSATLNNLLNFNPSALHNRTTHLNYLKGVSSFCFSSGALELGKILYEYGIHRNLSTQELTVVSEKAKEILAILKNNNFTDFNSYTLAEKKTIERNSLFISFLPDVSEILTKYWPKTQEEWAVLGDLFVQFLPDLVTGFIPGSSIIDVIKGFDKGDTIGIAFGIAGVIVDAFGGTIFKGLAKGAKVAYKVFTSFKLAYKFISVLGKALKKGLKIGLDGTIVKFLSKSGDEIARISNGIMTFKYKGFGGNIVTTPTKTTTIIGKYNPPNGIGTKNIIESGLSKSGKNTGGINVLNDPNFSGWKTNKDWLDEAISRGDIIRLISNPNNADGFFKKEIDYLILKGYDIVGNLMIKS